MWVVEGILMKDIDLGFTARAGNSILSGKFS